MPSGDLAFSVVLFLAVSTVCIIVLIIRRKVVGGELGGSKCGKYSSCALMCVLWFIYVLVSSLKVYGHIEGGINIGDPVPVPGRFTGVGA